MGHELVNIERRICEVDQSLKDIDEKVDHSHRLLHKIVELIEGSAAPSVGTLGLRISAIYGKGERTMIRRDKVSMVDVEKVELSASPTKPDGTADDSVAISWVSSDPAQVGIEEIPDSNGRRIFATTPLDKGAADVTISAKGYETTVQPIEYTPFVPGQLNVSAGTPVSDTP